MAENDSFADLLGRLRAGDEGAAALVVEQYAYRLAALAGSRPALPSGWASRTGFSR
jgi:hypothetical protein